MNHRKSKVTTLSLFGMEIIWIYAWAFFTMTAAFDRPYPLSSAICASGLAYLLTAVSMGRGWRWIGIIGIQLTGLGLVCLWTLYLMEMPAHSFFSSAWITEFFSSPKTFLQWAAVSMTIFWFLCFWIGGILLSRRSDNYDVISNRFDLGTGALLFLLLIELVIMIKWGSVPGLTLTAGGLFSFFIFSVLAFSLTRNRGNGHKGFISGYQGISAVVAFAMIILLLGTALVSFLLPYLTMTAQAGYGALKIIAQPMGNVILGILRFLFTSQKFRSDPASTSNSSQGLTSRMPIEEGGWLDSLIAIVGSVLVGIAILAALIVILFLLWKLLNLLLTRSAVQKRQPDTWRDLIDWLLKIPSIFFRWMRWIGSHLTGPQTAGQLYLSLMTWGRRGGVAHLPSDTPLEYGMRLRKKFPSMDHEIQTIIGAHNKAVYGRIPDSTGELAYAKASLGRLRRPALWPARLRSRLFPS